MVGRAGVRDGFRVQRGLRCRTGPRRPDATRARIRSVSSPEREGGCLCGAASAAEAVVAAAAPALFHAFGEAALFVGFRGAPPLGCALTYSGYVAAIRNGLARCGGASPHGGAVEGGSQ